MRTHVFKSNEKDERDFDTVVTCPYGFVGVHSIFRHGEKLGLWKFMDLPEAIRARPKLLIFGAWHPAYEALIPIVDRNTKIAIWLTSSVGQIEMVPEELNYLQFISDLKAQNAIDAILYTGKGVGELFNEQTRTFYMPYPLSTEGMISSEIEFDLKNKKEIAMFLPTHFRKNILNQLIAARILSADGFNLITNVAMTIQTKTQIKQFPWLNEKTYFGYLSGAIASLHCTWVESFSYGAAESIINGTIPILSQTIADNLFHNGLPEDIGTLIDSSIVKNLDCPYDIANKTKFIAEINKDEYLSILIKMQNCLFNYSIAESETIQKILTLVKSG